MSLTASHPSLTAVREDVNLSAESGVGPGQERLKRDVRANGVQAGGHSGNHCPLAPPLVS